LYHSTLGLRVIQKKKKVDRRAGFQVEVLELKDINIGIAFSAECEKTAKVSLPLQS